MKAWCRYLFYSVLHNTQSITYKPENVSLSNASADLEGVHIMNQASPKPDSASPAWAVAPQRRKKGCLVSPEPPGLLSGTLVVEHPAQYADF